jgi:membrane fusion protein, multidrug efflux system
MSDARHDRVLVASVLAAVIAATTCCGCGSVGRKLWFDLAAPPPPPIRPVRTVEISESGGAVTRSFTGTARAGDEARLSFKVAGSVREVLVRVGDRVQPGAKIAELDPIDFQLQVQQLDATLAQANAVARNAKANYERVRGLYVEDNASKADLDSARSATDSAEANVASARKARALAAQQLGYTRLVAAREGAVVDVMVNAGENVAAGQPIAVLASGEQPEVVIGVPASLIGRVEEGLPATAAFTALDGGRYAATVTEVGVATSTATAFPVTLRIDEVTSDIKPGMSAEVVIEFPPTEAREHIRVPAVAVAEDRLGTHVWTVEPEPGTDGLGTVRRRPVELGELTREGVDVVDGLTVGDRVVTAGVSRIRDGQTVRLPAAEAGEAP